MGRYLTTPGASRGNQASEPSVIDRLASFGLGLAPGSRELACAEARSPGLVRSWFIFSNQLHEAVNSAEFGHSGGPVAVLADFGYSPQGQAYLVMEYLEGEDLAQTIQRDDRMGWFRVSNLILQMASALAAPHAKDVAHSPGVPDSVCQISFFHTPASTRGLPSVP